MDNKMYCPCCGQFSEGTLVDRSNNSSMDFTEKCLVKGSKKIINPGKFIGATMNSFVPGSQAVGELIGNVLYDMVADALYNKAKKGLSSKFYTFHCEKCGHYWTSEDDMLENVTPQYTHSSSNNDKQILENEAYDQRQAYFWEKIDSITSSQKNVLEFAKKLTDCIYSPDLLIKNNILSAVACLIYTTRHNDDKNVISQGLDYINQAIRLIEDNDGECKMIQAIFNIYKLNYNAKDIVYQQKMIKSLPTLRNSLILNPEYLNNLYLSTRFDSLIKTEEQLKKRGDDANLIPLYLMIEELQVPSFQIYADYKLSICYAEGIGTSKSLSKAFDYAECCLERREFEAPFEHTFFNELWVNNLVNLSYCYTEGKGISKDYSLAFLYAKRASELGNPIGICNLADLYCDGLGVEKNLDIALSLYHEAAESDNEQAQKIALNKIAELDPKEIKQNNTEGNYETIDNYRESLSVEEQEYLDELQNCLSESDELSSSERRLLNRLRERLGISEKRAQELEDMLTEEDDFSPEEVEYFDEYTACLGNDGAITPRERRLLDKLAKSLGLTKEQVKRLEDF